MINHSFHALLPNSHWSLPSLKLLSLTVICRTSNARFASKGHGRGQRGDFIMSEIINSTELVTRDNVIVSTAPVSGNLYECGPLFVDEFSILLCASG